MKRQDQFKELRPLLHLNIIHFQTTAKVFSLSLESRKKVTQFGLGYFFLYISSRHTYNVRYCYKYVWNKRPIHDYNNKQPLSAL